MSAPAGDVAAVPAKPSGKRWFRPAAVARLSTDATRRESRIVRLALDTFGMARGEAFLNGFDASLGGSPLTIAADSIEGATAVERLIASTQGSFPQP